MVPSTQNNKSVTLTLPYVSTKEMIDKARNGSYDHLAALASMTCDEESIPENLYMNIFGLAAEYIKRPLPSKGDYSPHALRLAQFVCCSFRVTRNLPSKAFEKCRIAEGLLRIWPNAFTWAHYLRLAIIYIHKHHLDDDGEETSREFAAGISALLVATSKCKQTSEKYIADEKVFCFVSEFWAARNVIQDVAKEAAAAMNVFNVLRDDCLSRVFDLAEAQLDSFHEVASLAKTRARDALCDMDLEAMSAHYGVLFLLTCELCLNRTRRAALDEDFISLILDSMSILLDATYRSLVDRYQPLVLCMRMFSLISSSIGAGGTYIPQGFRHGLVDMYLKIGEMYEIFQTEDRLHLSRLFVEKIHITMHLKSVLQAVRQDMINYSRKQEHEPFHANTLKGDFKRIWQNFEILVMEHFILRHIHAMATKRVHVYCSNAECDTKGPSRIFMKCAGCKLAIYCSQKCQIAAWNASHSLECKAMRKEEYHRSEIPRCDKNYLLFWALVQIQRHLPALRRAAAIQMPGVTFEKIALHVDMVKWPMQILMHPLERTNDDVRSGKARAEDVHFRTHALHRVERGDGAATMLTIHYEDGEDWSSKFFVVNLDKSPVARVKRAKQGWKSKCQNALDEEEAPLEAIPDDVDGILDLVQRTAARLKLNAWIPGLIEGCVDDFFKKK